MTIRAHPMSADIQLARVITRNTWPLPEYVSSIITWGADGHVLTALAVGWWLCRVLSHPRSDAQAMVAPVECILASWPVYD